MGPFYAPPRAGHARGPLGGEPPPPILSQVQHVRHVAVFEQFAPGHGDVLQESREADDAISGRRGASE